LASMHFAGRKLRTALRIALRSILGLDPKHANYLIFPLNLEQRFQKIQRFNDEQPFAGQQKAPSTS
jgi:hypothetical protein